MQRPHYCAKPRHFCTLDVATFKKALDLTLKIYVQVLLDERYIARDAEGTGPWPGMNFMNSF